MTTYHLGTNNGYTPFCKASGAYMGHEDRATTIPVGTGTLFEPDRWCPNCLKVLAGVVRRGIPYRPPLKRAYQEAPSCTGSSNTTIV